MSVVLPGLPRLHFHLYSLCPSSAPRYPPPPLPTPTVCLSRNRDHHPSTCSHPGRTRAHAARISTPFVGPINILSLQPADARLLHWLSTDYRPGPATPEAENQVEVTSTYFNSRRLLPCATSSERLSGAVAPAILLLCFAISANFRSLLLLY